MTAAANPRIVDLKGDLASRTGLSFSWLLKKWEIRYGSGAVPDLLRIAADASESDSNRYIAILAAAKLGGFMIAPALEELLSDPCWMIRSAALLAARAIRDPDLAQKCLKLLTDPALVVRREAAETIGELRVPQSENALLAAIYSPENYHAGKAQGVPQAALHALAKLKAKTLAGSLRPLLVHFNDPALQRALVDSLDALYGEPMSAAPLRERIQIWDARLARED